MELDQSICTDLSIARRKEWIETNGLGGFASSTIIGMNTRRYHGLLVAATKPPVGRLVLLSKFEETLIIGDRVYDLSTNQYPGAIHPKGYRWQIGFHLSPVPTFLYRIEDVVLEKTVFMIHGENSTAVGYRLLSGPRDDVRIELRPLIAFRDYHGLTHENNSLNRRVDVDRYWIAVAPYPGLPVLYLSHNGAELLGGADWYRTVQYQEERERGLDWEEDLFNPFGLRFSLGQRDVQVIASIEPRNAARLGEFKSVEVQRRAGLIKGWEKSDALVHDLLRAADQFIVRRGDDLNTIIAGYHWFTDWGRDTMISLPGLTLIPRRYGEARKILLAFAEHCDRGMLPNRFPDEGEAPEFNTVDATLWFIQAVYAFTIRTGDYDLVRAHLYQTLTSIIDWHLRGTRYGIKVADDGLLSAGQSGVQLTWMDAKVGDEVVTPRIGKPVEIQALWYNALRVMEHLAQRFDDVRNEKLYGGLARGARRSFNQQFWNEHAGALFDCVDGENRDDSIRPNQIFAVSLPFSMLSSARMRQVVEVVTRELLTPFGLRTLSPRDPRYQGLYGGDPGRRDHAYHQGTVWAWLMGPYISARVRAEGGGKRARQAAAVLLTAFHAHMREAGLGTVSEIFDADPPHAPRGCIAQAWSVAELLRAAVEDVVGTGENESGMGRPAQKSSAKSLSMRAEK